MATEEDLRRICLSLPGVVEPEGPLPVFWARPKKGFAWIRTKPDALCVWCPNVDIKRQYMAEQPDKFWQTPHYEGHPVMLVHLERVTVDELEQLCTDAWMVFAPEKFVQEYLAR